MFEAQAPENAKESNPMDPVQQDIKNMDRRIRAEYTGSSPTVIIPALRRAMKAVGFTDPSDQLVRSYAVAVEHDEAFTLR